MVVLYYNMFIIIYKDKNMKRIKYSMLWLFLTFVFSSLSYAQSNYLLNAGENITISRGQEIPLNGKIVKGDKQNIVEYRWEELGTTLKDIDNDPIVYENYTQSEYSYKAKSAGRHRLTFKVKDKEGKFYEDSLILTVKSESKDIKLSINRPVTLHLGATFTLHGYVSQGNKSDIEYYHWEENGKVLKNVDGAEILFYDYANRYNDIKLTTGGKHVLTFVAHDFTGKLYKKSFTLTVHKVKVDSGGDVTLEQGDIIKLEGKVFKTKEKIIKYTWKLGTLYYDKFRRRSVYRWDVIKDINGKKIIYFDNKDRVHYYKPKNYGTVYLKFVVITADNSESSSWKKLTITPIDIPDDHGDTFATATPIVVNKEIPGVLNTTEDKDYFKFTLDKKQYLYSRLTTQCTRQYQSLYNDKHQFIQHQLFFPHHTPYRSKNTLLEKGVYYLNIHGFKTCDNYNYTFEIETHDIQTKDVHGNTKETASEIPLNGVVKGYLVSNLDIDFFKITPKKAGEIRLELLNKPRPTGIRRIAPDGAVSYGQGAFPVKAGETYYFSMSHRHPHADKQAYYEFSVAFKPNK